MSIVTSITLERGAEVTVVTLNNDNLFDIDTYEEVIGYVAKWAERQYPGWRFVEFNMRIKLE